ncbi:MAG: hypothetical protein PHV34_09620 [Verrucomicrobiae bacterium]|nr:hypothetical protein [Verrucomicrobiae bacterium]
MNEQIPILPGFLPKTEISTSPLDECAQKNEGKSNETIKKIEALLVKAQNFSGNLMALQVELLQMSNADSDIFLRMNTGFAKFGGALLHAESLSCPSKKKLDAASIIPFRNALIREFNIQTTAEFMILDGMMRAYSRAQFYDFMAANLGNKEGTTGYSLDESDLKMNAKIVDLAVKYHAQFLSYHRALMQIKQPPFSIKVGSAEKIGIQVNQGAPIKSGVEIHENPRRNKKNG